MSNTEFSATNGENTAQNALNTQSANGALDSEQNTAQGVATQEQKSIKLSEFLQSSEGKGLPTNDKGQFMPDKKQLKILVHCLDDSVDKTNPQLISLSKIDTSKVTNMKALFYKSDRVDFSGIEEWDVSNVTGFELCFAQCRTFNAPIEKWGDKIKNARTFEKMFWNAEQFNRPIGAHWDTSSATNMIGMFSQARKFNNGGQEFGEKWKMDKVQWTWQMFWNAEKFNQPLNEWNMSSVTKCYTMFNGAKAFNQPLDKWDLSNAIDMSHMFSGAESFNQNLSAWGTKLGKVRNMTRMFANTKALNQTFAWKLNENCDLTNVAKGSVLKLDITFVNDDGTTQEKEILQDTSESSLTSTTKQIQLATSKENFKLYQIVKKDKNLSDDDYTKAIISFLNKKNWQEYDRKQLYSWIPKNIREDYKIYLAKKQDKAICGADESEWDFICYKIFGYLFVVETDEKTFDISQSALKKHERRMVEIKQVNVNEEDDESNDEENIDYKSNSLSISLERDQIMYIYNANTNADMQNSDRIFNIIGALVLAKAYESKMYDFNKMARQAIRADLMKCHKEICEFDLKFYQNVPVQVHNSSLLNFWEKLAWRYKINERHEELQDTIARIAQLVSDEMREQENKIREKESAARDKQSLTLNRAMVVIGILSLFGVLFSAISLFK